MKAGFYQRYIKRPMDIALAITALLLFLPCLLGISILIRIKLGAPVLFKQQRPGLKEKIFTLYKFRTMTVSKEEKGIILPDSARMTNFGRLLRASSLDELPELFNILKGDMSFVGPRPLLIQYLPLYNEQQKQRHEVRPGLSGLAQIKGRNAICWEDKFRLDYEYVHQVTFVGDWKIILLTLKKVFTREGIHSEHTETMEEYEGNQRVGGEEMEHKNQLLIIGASGHGRVVAEVAQKMNQWKQIAFLDDNQEIKSFMGRKVLGTSKEVRSYLNHYDIFVAIGNNSIRERLLNELELAGASLPVLIHPKAVIGEDVDLGAGTVVMAGVVINGCSRIGKGCIINTSSSIDHDNILEDYVHISPGAHLAGTVTIGKGTWLGIGSIVINNRHITGGCIIGAGAVVVKDIMVAGTYVGVPARRF